MREEPTISAVSWLILVLSCTRIAKRSIHTYKAPIYHMKDDQRWRCNLWYPIPFSNFNFGSMILIVQGIKLTIDIALELPPKICESENKLATRKPFTVQQSYQSFDRSEAPLFIRYLMMS